MEVTEEYWWESGYEGFLPQEIRTSSVSSHSSRPLNPHASIKYIQKLPSLKPAIPVTRAANHMNNVAPRYCGFFVSKWMLARPKIFGKRDSATLGRGVMAINRVPFSIEIRRVLRSRSKLDSICATALLLLVRNVRARPCSRDFYGVR